MKVMGLGDTSILPYYFYPSLTLPMIIGPLPLHFFLMFFTIFHHELGDH